MYEIEFDYTNYRGERSKRRIQPKRIWRGSTEHHPEHQLFLSGWDLEKGADRDFAAKDVEDWPRIEREASTVIRRNNGGGRREDLGSAR